MKKLSMLFLASAIVVSTSIKAVGAELQTQKSGSQMSSSGTGNQPPILGAGVISALHVESFLDIFNPDAWNNPNAGNAANGVVDHAGNNVPEGVYPGAGNLLR
ncbi:MAG: hypothetical protein WCH05_02710 [Chlorobiaceae bacterium]